MNMRYEISKQKVILLLAILLAFIMFITNQAMATKPGVRKVTELPVPRSFAV